MYTLLERWLEVLVRINPRVSKKLLLVLLSIFLALTIASSILLSIAYHAKPFIEHTTTVKYCELSVDISNTARVKPALIYDYVENISSNKIYLNLLRYIVLNIGYEAVIYNDTKYGVLKRASTYYTVDLAINSNTWSKSLKLVKPIRINSPRFNTMILLNMSEIQGIVGTIEREIGIKSQSYTLVVTMNIQTFVEYTSNHNASYKISPKIKVIIDREDNIVTISEDKYSKSYVDKKRVDVKNTFNILGLDITASRTIFLYTTIALAISLFIITWIYTKETMYRDVVKRYISLDKPYVLPGKIIDPGDKSLVEINDFRKFLSIAKRHSKPIILSNRDKYRELYVIVEDTIYKYRLDKS